MWGRIVLGCLGLAACGPGRPDSLSIDVGVGFHDDATIRMHLESGRAPTRADGHLEVWVDTVGAPEHAARCHFAADFTASQFEGPIGASVALPFPPGCDGTVPGQVPPFDVRATFTMRDGTVVPGDGSCTQELENRITYRPPPAPEVVVPAVPPSTTITTGSCNTSVAGACEEWTMPADQLAFQQQSCTGEQSTWSLAACPSAGALGRCVLPTETIYSYGIADGAAEQCARFGGQYATLTP